MSRKKAANRAKRMAGMGLDPSTGLPLHAHNPYKDPRSLINPWQDSRAAGNASPDRCGTNLTATVAAALPSCNCGNLCSARLTASRSMQ
jgi:hypothetical protein